jgi:urease accessory protein
LSWLIWQLVDSAFPAGGFAHSFGLEAAWQQEEVDAASLPAFVREGVSQAGYSSLPFILAAYDDPSSLALFDARCDAFLRNPVANRASRVQGRAWLGAVTRALPHASVRAAGNRHFAPLFGATMQAVDVEREDAARMFLFGVARGTFSAAVRLGVVGTTEGQRMLADCGPHLELIVSRCGDLAIDDAAQTSPLIDLWQASHDRLYSRLFQS